MTPTLGLGGSEKLTVRYANGLRERGHEVVIAYGVKNFQADSIEQLTTVQLTTRRLTRGSALEWSRSLRRLIRTFRPDIVHAQSVKSAFLVRSAAPTVPLLVTIHGMEHTKEPMAALSLKLMRVRVTAVSGATVEGLARFPWSPPVEPFYAGIDIARLRSESTGEKTFEMVGAPRLCCVARMYPQKGIDILLHALTSILKVFPDAGLTLVGEGDDLEEYRLSPTGSAWTAERYSPTVSQPLRHTSPQPTSSSLRHAGKVCRSSRSSRSRSSDHWSQLPSTGHRRSSSTAKRAGWHPRRMRRPSQR